MNKNIIPNIFTFTNLSFGMMAIMFTITGDFKLASFMIICAAFVDRYDGRIARKFSAESPLGKELDSLADLVSFGVAPAIVAWGMFLNSYGIIGYIIALIFPISGAFRLARFNVTVFNKVFMGIPITIAGAFMALDYLINLYFIKHYLISTLLILLLAYFMVSKIKIKKL